MVVCSLCNDEIYEENPRVGFIELWCLTCNKMLIGGKKQTTLEAKRKQLYDIVINKGMAKELK
jgi:hypothetical protein